MNKKFTMLLASAMLVTALSANAQFSDGVKKDSRLLLQAGSEYLAVGDEGAQFGALQSAQGVESSLSTLNQATWKVTAVRSSLGKKLYSFVNPATGLTLAIDPSTAYDADKVKTKSAIKLGGSATEWVLEGSSLVSYGDGYVLSIAQEGGEFYAVKAKDLRALSALNPLSVSEGDLTTIGDMTLSASDLNTLLQSLKVSDESDLFFGLKMDPEVSNGQKNHLTATSLHASAAGAGYGSYVYLYNGSKVDEEPQYVVVDTAYWGGTESSRMLKFTYDKLNADGRNPGSYAFKFEYSPKNDELYVSVASVSYGYLPAADANGRVTSAALAAFNKEIVEKNNNTFWPVYGEDAYVETTNVKVFPDATGEYIYMSKLVDTNVLTVNVKGGTRTDVASATTNQNVKITLGTSFTGLTLTTIPDGVYTIQYKTAIPKDKGIENDAYALANLGGSLGWAYQAARQDFNHMPAAQWVVKKNGTSNTATVSITNREFNDQKPYSIFGSDGKSIQFFAVEGSDDVFCFRYSTKDTLLFHKVADDLVKDTKLGYKYVSKDDAMVQTYTFNYLHGLALDKYMYTPAGKDSIVRVDENGSKSSFRLEVVTVDDHYGYDGALLRNAYYVYNSVNGERRYLSYDEGTKKYMMKGFATPFFLKENNCIDGKHYYALIPASYYRIYETEKQLDAKFTNYYTSLQYEYDKETDTYVEKTIYCYWVYDKDGNSLINDNSKVDLYSYSSPDDKLVKMIEGHVGNSISYAQGVKVSVDDNTLDLTQGSIYDKSTIGNNREIRTSAFAIEIDDSPLYRRFNNDNLGEKEGTLNLSFVEKIRGEYLMDEWNEKLQDKTVDYAGIWNKDKADGKLAFVVDTAWVNRGLGYIKPQYLISVARNDQEGTPGVPCTYEHNHYDNAGNKVDAAHCSHATKGHDGFRYGKYLVSFGDSAIDNRDKSNNLFTPYMDVNNGYTRVGFVEAIHYGDSLIILTGEYENADPAKLDIEEIIAAYKKAKTENLIVNLRGDNHKNVTWSFRYVTPSNDAVKATEEGSANEFLFESNIYQENGNSTLYTQRVDNSDPKSPIVSVSGKATKGFTKTVGGSIAPAHAAWLKMQNGCLVLTRGDSKFEAAKTGSDGALIFNAYQKTDAEDMVTSIEGANAEGVSIVAGNGVVTVQGAAGKSVVITNILGKVIAETVLTSDNATISVPAGIVAVAVEGEEAVKAIVK